MSYACMLTCFSGLWLFRTLWTAACQTPLSVGLSRQEYWSGVPFPSPGDLPNPGMEPASLISPMGCSVQFSSVAQSCLTPCDPVDCSPPGSSVHGILQARILEWGAISSSRGSSQPWDQTYVSVTPALQVDKCTGFKKGRS